MPNTIRDAGQFIQSGNPDTENVVITGGSPVNPTAPPVPGSFVPYAPGQVGISLELGDKTYTPVYVDSGCTSATPTGQVLANTLLFWKDKANRIVTNDRRFALGNAVAQGSCNFVAGISRVAVGVPGAGGNLIWMLVKGYNIPVKAGTVSGGGQICVADVDANGPQVLGTAVGTGPSYMPLGVSRAAAASNSVNLDVEIPILP